MNFSFELEGEEAETLTRFAEIQFKGDYGLAIRDLVREKMIRTDHMMPLIVTIQELEARISKIEAGPVNPKPPEIWKERRMCDGTIKRWKQKVQNKIGGE